MDEDPGELRRMYGFFECQECDRQWESSHVYCKADTEEVAYGQECDDCNEMCKPYRVESLKCADCNKIKCECDGEDFEYDPDKTHRSDLCGKCQAGRPCT